MALEEKLAAGDKKYRAPCKKIPPIKIKKGVGSKLVGCESKK
jgi:hypothetical protein